jgi:chromosome segregation ATPase
MITEEINKLAQRIEDVEMKFETSDCDEYDKLEEEVYDIEEELAMLLESADNAYHNIDLSNSKRLNMLDKEQRLLEKLSKKIRDIKKEYDFYDEEAELDMMFPNRHDDDFDEDSMSYDSVFGDD